MRVYESDRGGRIRKNRKKIRIKSEKKSFRATADEGRDVGDGTNNSTS